MADHDIQKSQHLLKSLEKEIAFLSSLLDQALYVTSGLKGTCADIRKAHEIWQRDAEKS